MLKVLAAGPDAPLRRIREVTPGLEVDLVLAFEVEHFPGFIRRCYSSAERFDHCPDAFDLVGIGRGQLAWAVPQ